MSEQPVMLKILLREKHWQNYSTFCAESNKAARRIAPDLAGRYPSRAQLHRWLTGAVRSLPFADHCRVLEEMFSGWTAEQLFQPSTGERPLTAPGGAAMPPASVVLSTGLRPYIERAFTAEHVIIDFAGFSGETLHGVLQETLDKIRTGEIKPESVSIRMLLPDTTRPMAVPCRVEDLADDPGYRARMHQVTGRHAYAILETVQELARLGRIKEASTEIHAYQVPPLFKLYLLNGDEAFFGLYPLVEHAIPFPDGSHPMYDLMGKDAVVFRHSKNTGDAADAQFVAQAQAGLNSMWNPIRYEFPA